MFKMHNRSDYILQSKQYLSEHKNKEELNQILKENKSIDDHCDESNVFMCLLVCS